MSFKKSLVMLSLFLTPLLVTGCGKFEDFLNPPSPQPNPDSNPDIHNPDSNPTGPKIYNVHLESNDIASGSVRIVSKNKGPYQNGETVEIQAFPCEGCLFDGWYDIDSDILISRKPTYTLKITNDVKCYGSFISTSYSKFFGSYPQTAVDKVKDAELYKMLIKIADYPTDDPNNGYHTIYGDYYIGKPLDNVIYKDVNYSFEKYRAVVKKDGERIIDRGFFKYEPIKWIKKTDDNLLISKYILDYHLYDTDNSQYAYSDVRNFLNGNFMNMAFTESEQNSIAERIVNNSLVSTGDKINPNTSTNTTDKLFLLSKSDLTDSKLGFADNYDRTCLITDYAKFMNVDYAENGCGKYLTRTPAQFSTFENICVSDSGAFVNSEIISSSTGIRPACYLKDDSDSQDEYRSIKITNKREVETMIAGDPSIDLKVTTDPEANISMLVKQGKITSCSSRPNIAKVEGLRITPLNKGIARITVQLDDCTDYVDIFIDPKPTCEVLSIEEIIRRYSSEVIGPTAKPIEERTKFAFEAIVISQSGFKDVVFYDGEHYINGFSNQYLYQGLAYGEQYIIDNVYLDKIYGQFQIKNCGTFTHVKRTIKDPIRHEYTKAELDICNNKSRGKFETVEDFYEADLALIKNAKLVSKEDRYGTVVYIFEAYGYSIKAQYNYSSSNWPSIQIGDVCTLSGTIMYYNPAIERLIFYGDADVSITQHATA